jgi:hypothetical protein
MKRVFFLLILVLFCAAALPAHSAEIQTFILKDGSKVRGQLLELNNGVYIIKTPDGAQTRVRAKKIAKIITPKKKTESPKKNTQTKNTKTKNTEPVDPLSEAIASNPTLLEDVANLKDPAILQMLQDPDFQAAVKEIKDPKQLATDPRTKKFYAHPEIKALLKKQQKPKKTKTASTTK